MFHNLAKTIQTKQFLNCRIRVIEDVIRNKENSTGSSNEHVIFRGFFLKRSGVIFPNIYGQCTYWRFQMSQLYSMHML